MTAITRWAIAMVLLWRGGGLGYDKLPNTGDLSTRGSPRDRNLSLLLFLAGHVDTAGGSRLGAVTFFCLPRVRLGSARFGSFFFFSRKVGAGVMGFVCSQLVAVRSGFIKLLARVGPFLVILR